MIRARRIGHATFQTPDLDKAIADHESSRSSPSSPSARRIAPSSPPRSASSSSRSTSRIGALLQPGVRIRAQLRFRRHGQRACKRGHPQRAAQRFHPGVGQVLAFADDKGEIIIELFRMSDCASTSRSPGSTAQLGDVAFFTSISSARSAFYEKVLGFRVPPDRRFLLFHALQSRPSQRELYGLMIRPHHIAFSCSTLSICTKFMR